MEILSEKNKEKITPLTHNSHRGETKLKTKNKLT